MIHYNNLRQKTFTASEYAARRGISVQAVSQAIKRKYHLPAVVKIERFGNAWALTCELSDSGEITHYNCWPHYPN
jgi:hypothetical protein